MDKPCNHPVGEGEGLLGMCAAKVIMLIIIEALDIKSERLVLLHSEPFPIDIKSKQTVAFAYLFYAYIIAFKLALGIVRMDRKGSIRVCKREEAAPR